MGGLAGGATRGIVLYSPAFVGGEKFEAAMENGQLEVALIKVPKTFGCTMRSAQAMVSLAAWCKARTGHPLPVEPQHRPPLGDCRCRRQVKSSWNYVTKDKSPTLEVSELMPRLRNCFDHLKNQRTEHRI